MSAAATTFDGGESEKRKPTETNNNKQNKNINYQNMRDKVYIINEAPLSMQKEFLNQIFHED